jgi:protein TonB
MTRYLSAFSTALFVTISLFYLMQYLISGKHSPLAVNQSGDTFDIIRLNRTEEIVTKQRQLPEPPKEPVAPTKFPELAKDTNNPQIIPPKVNLPVPGIPSMQLQRSLLSGVSAEVTTPQENSEVTALLRVEPDYPRKAAIKGVEGWVKLRFTVLEDGSVTNVIVIDSKPRRVFEKSAIRAIKRWKFKPRIVNGKAVKQTAIQVIAFELNK